MTIKEIAGKILLYYYEIQRENPVKLHQATTFFELKPPGEFKSIGGNDEINTNLLKISDSTPDLYNAFNYLRQQGMLATDSNISNQYNFHGMYVSDRGIDIIEGIERGEEEKRQFNITFNINVENNMNVESLVKANLSMLGLGL